MDKLWAERRLDGAPYEYDMGEHKGDWMMESAKQIHGEAQGAKVLPPQARTSTDGTWSAQANAWSAALGAVGGAGTVFLIALLLFIFKKPKRHDPPQLAPMDVAQNEMLIPREQCRVQPLSERSASSLPHARLARTPSISSQSSLDSGTSRATSHRGSSPAIRTFAPDGRTLEAGVSGMPRSPSPLRAASLDVRAAPLGSLASLADSPAPPSPRHIPPRCLSPLLMPPRRIDRSNSLVENSSGAPLSPGASTAISSLGALQPDLYTKRETPLVIELEGVGPSLGRIHLRLKYDFDRSDLEVHLIEAHDLAGYEAGGFNDPYVRVSLLPEVDTRVRQTPVHRNEANPFFDQHFKFPVSHDDLTDKTLLLQVFDYDRFSRNEVMGSAKVPLSRVEVAGGAEVWAELSRERRPPEELQELLLSLSFLPSAERLTVVVLKARNLLPPQEGKDALDVYVKVYLLVNGKRVKKKKTNRKEINNPIWNEALSFSLPSSNLQEASIEVCVVTGGGSGLVVGWCCVGAAEPAAEGRHWAQMAQETRKAVAMWHTLR
ncbi:synaptotagmin-5-like isoform X1 [Danaus plexippus]|uniref:synaptotagmin-5-like isoform X1 n=1 Tax=Danaus plexippus TaxID=13037 RepID=UPI0013C41F9B|nr:synaptotagmin-5-like isoform X1 [Danaus plexippus plexippus]XP_061379003.1 synaptotagmin-5-like isoform X1 [Danaus plexippus]